MLYFFFVAGTALACFFSEEIIRYLKWLLDIPGVLVFLPLLLASLLVETHLIMGWWGLTSLRSGLFHLEHKLAEFIPFKVGAIYITRVLLLTVIAVIPVWITWLRTRKKMYINALFWASRIGALAWIVSVIALLSLM